MTDGPALLNLDRASIGTRERLTLTGVDLCSETQHLLLIEPAMSIFRLLAGRGPEQLLAGKVTLLGHDVLRREHHAACGVLAVETALPARWTIRHYLSWAARISGATQRGAQDRVEATLHQLGLTSLSKQPLRFLGANVRMALRFAAAVIHDPQVLVLELPGQGWGADEATLIHRWLEQCCSQARLLLCAPTLPIVESAWLDEATEACILHRGTLLAQETPGAAMANAAMYAVTVTQGAEALCARLKDDGMTLHGGPRHFTVRLPAGLAPRDLLCAATETEATIVQLEPIFAPAML